MSDLKIISSILTDCKIFKGLSQFIIEAKMENIHYFTKKFIINNSIANMNSKCKNLMIVLSGSVRGEMTDFDGKTVEIEKIRPSGIIAPAFLFGEKNIFPVDVISDNETEILYIPKEFVINLIQSEKLILKNYLDVLSSKSQFLTRRIKFISFKTIKEKMAFYLLNLSKGKDEFKIKRNQKQLSEFFGVTRVALARVLNKMRDNEIIDYKGKYIKILSRRKLIEYCKKQP